MISRTTAARWIWYLALAAFLVIGTPTAVFGFVDLPFVLFPPFVVAALLFASVYRRRDRSLVWWVLAAVAAQFFSLLGMMASPDMYFSIHGVAWKSIITVPPFVIIGCWMAGSLLPLMTAVAVLITLGGGRRMPDLQLATTDSPGR